MVLECGKNALLQGQGQQHLLLLSGGQLLPREELASGPLSWLQNFLCGDEDFLCPWVRPPWHNLVQTQGLQLLLLVLVEDGNVDALGLGVHLLNDHV